MVINVPVILKGFDHRPEQRCCHLKSKSHSRFEIHFYSVRLGAMPLRAIPKCNGGVIFHAYFTPGLSKPVENATSTLNLGGRRGLNDIHESQHSLGYKSAERAVETLQTPKRPCLHLRRKTLCRAHAEQTLPTSEKHRHAIQVYINSRFF